jgi:putative ABC transport system permease protein
METFIRDIRYGFRNLVRRPGFTAIVIITLAVGIGANTAIFSLVNATLLRPLPFKDPDQLVVVWGTAPDANRRSVSEPNFLQYQEQNHVFEQIATFNSAGLTLTDGANPERVRGARVSANFFNLLGVQPAVGHTFLPEDGQPGHNEVAVISHDFWQRRFGSDQNIVGRKILIEAKPYTVIAVLPAAFDFSIPSYFANAELWVPALLRRDEAQRGKDYLRVIGRLKTGTTLAQAQTDMNAIAHQLTTEHPDLGVIGTNLVPLKEQIVRDMRRMLLLLLGAVGFVLLIACANVANLQMARASGRRKEFAIRAALGASRRRVLQQLLTESLLLSLLGGAVGLALGWGSMKLLLQPDLGGFPGSTLNRIDLVVIIYSLLISILTGILFGLAPAFQSAASNLSGWLKEGGKTSGAGAGGQRLRSLLTIAEIALCLVLLVGAGLLLRSFSQLLKVEPGFETEHILSLRVVLPSYSYGNGTKQAAFYSQATERLAALPGVKSVGAISALPLTASRHSADFTIQGREDFGASQLPLAETRTVTPNYFQTMGIPLIAGRTFGEGDTGTAPPVLMINQSLARRFFPNENPVGHRITFDAPPAELEWLTIVGVVQDVRDLGLETPPEPEIYQPFEQDTLPYMNLVVRAVGDPRSVASAVRNEVRALDKDLPVGVPEPMETTVASSIAPRKFNMIILGVFAGLAMLLAIVGIYGVMSYAVSQRTQEIGLRMALGAQRRDVLKLIMGGGMKLALIGVVIGLAVALWLTRLMTTLLFGVTPADGVTFATVTLVLILVALLACYIPARRATKIDPLKALRYQ